MMLMWVKMRLESVFWRASMRRLRDLNRDLRDVHETSKKTATGKVLG